MTDTKKINFGEVADSFCVYPFLELNISPNGQVRPCCAFANDLAQDGRPLSVSENTVEEIWNSKTLRDLRQRMIAGQPIEGCAYCYNQTRNGLRSLWEDANDSFQSGWLNPEKLTLEDLRQQAKNSDCVMPYGPQRFDLRVSNTCNLKCRMCNSSSSSSIAADPVQVRWPYPLGNFPAVARWKKLESSIGPQKVIGVKYQNVPEVDWSLQQPVAWINGKSSFEFDIGSIDFDGIKLVLVFDVDCSKIIKISVNGNLVFNEIIKNKNWQHIFTPQLLALSSTSIKLEIEISSSIAGEKNDIIFGLEQIAILRKTAQSNSISIGRFSSGKQWYQNASFIEEDLFYDLAAVNKINIVGGEPLLIPEVRSIMRFLVSRNVAQNITLSFTTNATVFDEEWRELALKFQSLIIAVSVDGVRDVNNYIRHPSDWSAIEKNIQALKSLPNAYVYINMTISMYNLLKVNEVIDFCEEAGIDFRYHAVEEPSHLNIQNLPIEIREIAAERLRRVSMRNEPDQQRHNRFVDYREQAMSLAKALELTPGEGNQKKEIEEFMIFTNDLDESRNQQFSSIGSELIELLARHGHPWTAQTRYAKFARP